MLQPIINCNYINLQIEFIPKSNMLLYLFCLFVAVIIGQFFYYVFVFRKFTFSNPKVLESKSFPVSVIVCSKNEAENVRKFIPILTQQDYKEYEIVLIDDASVDETAQIFEDFEKTYDNIKIVSVNNNEAFWGNKKFALTLGIKAATHNHLLFIDADCYPRTKNWISQMTAHFQVDKEIIIGYGGYEKIKSSFLNKLIRFETLMTAIQYFSWANLGKPYMGVGRNLAYKRETFFKVNGFVNHMKIPSGDDDLFVNQAATVSNIAVCFTKDSFTLSKPKLKFRDWFNQKRRHISTAKHYKLFDKIQLSVFFISHFLFFSLATILLLYKYQWIVILWLVGFRYLTTWVMVAISAKKLAERDLILWYPILEIFLILIQIRLFFANTISKPTTWK
jgi:glycosyltransferase involved in cell wall biosynthesis